MIKGGGGKGRLSDGCRHTGKWSERKGKRHLYPHVPPQPPPLYRDQMTSPSPPIYFWLEGGPKRSEVPPSQHPIGRLASPARFEPSKSRRSSATANTNRLNRVRWGTTLLSSFSSSCSKIAISFDFFYLFFFIIVCDSSFWCFVPPCLERSSLKRSNSVFEMEYPYRKLCGRMRIRQTRIWILTEVPVLHPSPSWHQVIIVYMFLKFQRNIFKIRFIKLNTTSKSFCLRNNNFLSIKISLRNNKF